MLNQTIARIQRQTTNLTRNQMPVEIRAAVDEATINQTIASTLSPIAVGKIHQQVVKRMPTKVVEAIPKQTVVGRHRLMRAASLNQTRTPSPIPIVAPILKEAEIAKTNPEIPMRSPIKTRIIPMALSRPVLRALQILRAHLILMAPLVRVALQILSDPPILMALQIPMVPLILVALVQLPAETRPIPKNRATVIY